MPSARTHDAVTFLLAAPAFAAAYLVTRNAAAALTLAVAFAFGGLMFGPDLDTVSRQYTRWWHLRILWLPYRRFFKHRSRFSHGLIFGALLRVFYFAGVMTLIGFGTASIYTAIRGGRPPTLADIAAAWRPVDNFLHHYLGESFYLLGFLGLWLGAASHTFTDMAGSFIRTGKIAKFL